MNKLTLKIFHLSRTIYNQVLKLLLPESSNPLELLGYKEELSQNIKFKDKYKGERCFIVGGGPSLKKQDLLQIKGENIFFVNSLPYQDIFDSLLPNFYVTWDDIQFAWDDPDIGEHRKKLFRKIRKVTPDTTWILPAKQKQRIEKSGFVDMDKILYTYWGAKWKPYLKKRNDFDFESQIPDCNNVIDIAIMAAMYMGFEEIFLLGVDMTSFLSMYEYSYDKEMNMNYRHFYEYSKDERKVIDKVLYANASNEARLEVATNKLKYFRYINEIALKKGTKIFNMSAGGGLDVFPRIRYEDWLKDNK